MPLNLRPIVKEETTKERVYKEMKNAILCGEISSNVFFTELQLAESLNTSRTPVREAINDLIKEGLIISVPRKGLAVKQISDIEMEQIFLLRTTIEGAVIKKVASVITKEQLNDLEDICKEQEVAMNEFDNERFIQLDQEFHMHFQRIGKYELIEQVLLNLHDLSKLIGLSALKKQNRMAEVLDEHRQIIKSLRKGDAEMAVLKLDEHLQKTKDSIVL